MLLPDQPGPGNAWRDGSRLLVDFSEEAWQAKDEKITYCWEGYFMLFAVDIDNTVSTYRGTDALEAYVRSIGIPLSPDWHMNDYPLLLSDDALLQDPLYAAWYKEQGEPKEYIKNVLYEGQYSPVFQERAVPIPGAAETLTRLREEGNQIVYITNRKNITWDVTSVWLAQYGFPCPEKLHCCGDEEGFVSKMRHACSCLQTGER